ncbi:MAG: penicillin-binding protein [Parcubacteria group bacterium]|nr:penicillin-binding protein [Parcubacteria group bacterium]
MKRQKKKLIAKIAVFLFLISLGGGAIGLAAVAKIAKTLPRVDQFDSRQVAQSTKIYDRSGEVLLYEIHGEEKRTVVPFNEIPVVVKEATLAIEDAEFYGHPAYNWRSVLRALWKNAVSGAVSQGGSTITQQLAKNAFLSPEKTLTRKIKELLLSVQLEKIYSKDEILGLYLNQIPYGSNAYGIEAAAQTYFGKSARDLKLPEAAALASMLKAPTYYSPWGTHIDELLERKDYIIGRMLELGFIDQEEKNRALKMKLKFSPKSIGIKAPHFVMMVKEYLTNKYGEEAVARGGLRVVTSLDWNLQQIAEKTIADGVSRNAKLYSGKNGSLVAQDPKTGQILALVGSKDFFDVDNDGNFNVAAQGLRQPGSAFKPFAYVTAFKKGYTPETIVFDAPTEFVPNNPDCPITVNFSNENSECFHPENFTHSFAGPVSLRNALAQSINVPAVKVLYLAGVNDTIKTANDFGVTTINDPRRYGLSLVLGGGEVKLLEMVGAYSVFAQDGIKHKQSLVLKIENTEGKIIEEYKDEAAQVIEPQYAKMINDVLSDNEARTPLFGANNQLTVPGQDVAVKTGTTNDYRDAWTIGYSRSLVAGVWAGNNDNAPMQKQGGSILAAVPIWSEFMNKAAADRPLETFASPDPYYPTKPVLKGEYVVNYEINGIKFPQIHDILYYVNKNDPNGEDPKDPAADPQFANWEIPALSWAESNIANFRNYNLALPEIRGFAHPSSSAEIIIFSPKNGDLTGDSVSIDAEIKSPNPLVKIELFFNGALAETRSGSLGNNYRYRYDFRTTGGDFQNLITIKATDALRGVITKDVIVFK